MDTLMTWRERLISKTTKPTLHTTYKYWIWLTLLIVVVGNGIYQYSKQTGTESFAGSPRRSTTVCWRPSMA